MTTDYRYIIPGSIDEAFKTLCGAEEVKILAGGTDLMVRVRDGKETPEILLDIAGLGFDYIAPGPEAVSIGAMTPLAEITMANFREPFAILAEAAIEIGGVQTRNMGTVGGNLCMGIPSADLAVPMLALEARLKLISASGERIVPATDFFLAPRKTVLGKHEILKEIMIMHPDYDKDRWGSSFLKLGSKKSMRLTIVSAGAVVNINPLSMVINKIAAAMGNVAPVPVRLFAVEQYMAGKCFSEQLLREAAEVMKKELAPRTSMRATMEYREYIAPVLFKRAVRAGIERALKGAEL